MPALSTTELLRLVARTALDPRDALRAFIADQAPVTDETALAFLRGEPRRLRKYLADLEHEGSIGRNQSGARVFLGWHALVRRTYPPAQASIGFADDLMDARSVAPVPFSARGARAIVRIDSDRIVPPIPSLSRSDSLLDPNRSESIRSDRIDSDRVKNRIAQEGLSEARQFERRRLYDLIGWPESRTGCARVIWEPGLRRIELRLLRERLSEAREKQHPARWLNTVFRALLQCAPAPAPTVGPPIP